MSPQHLRNRLVLATGMWRHLTKDPLPKLPAGEPAEQIEAFELLVVERARAEATVDNAKEIADATWDLVHDRPDGDRVKSKVTELHEELARLTHGAG